MNVIKKQILYVSTLIVGTQLAPCSKIHVEKLHIFTQINSIGALPALSRNNQERARYFAYDPGRVGGPRRTSGSGARWIPQVS